MTKCKSKRKLNNKPKLEMAKFFNQIILNCLLVLKYPNRWLEKLNSMYKF